MPTEEVHLFPAEGLCFGLERGGFHDMTTSSASWFAIARGCLFMGKSKATRTR